ncbi:MAG: SufE family protein [Candidatus Buchananbacteria bacterium]
MTTQKIQQEIIKEFGGSAKDWLKKYGQLMKLGKTLPSAEEAHKIEDNLVKGCQVRTWYGSTFKDGKVFYKIDSLSLIIKGAVVLLLRVLNGRTPEEIKNTELYFIDQTGLRELFSPVKANSLWKVINRMQTDAANYGAKRNK